MQLNHLIRIQDITFFRLPKSFNFSSRFSFPFNSSVLLISPSSFGSFDSTFLLFMFHPIILSIALAASGSLASEMYRENTAFP